MNKILAALNALKAGESLANPEIWKNRQLASNAIVAVVSTIPQLLPVEISQSDAGTIAWGAALVGSIVNAYLTPATTSKIGL